jgi:hypothetical protein
VLPAVVEATLLPLVDITEFYTTGEVFGSGSQEIMKKYIMEVV